MTYFVIAVIAVYVVCGLARFRKAFRVICGERLPTCLPDLFLMVIITFAYSTMAWGFVLIHDKFQLDAVSIARRIAGTTRDQQRKVTTLELEFRSRHEPDDLDVALEKDRCDKGLPRGGMKKEGNPPF
jgi:hypothetical protein